MSQPSVSQPVLYPDWRPLVSYGAAGPQPRVIAAAGEFKVLLAGLEPDQRIPPHPEGLAVYTILEGTGWMDVAGERFAIGPGAVVVAPDNAPRGIEATTRLAFLAARSR